MKSETAEQIMDRILVGVSCNEDGCTYENYATQPIRELLASIESLRTDLKVLAAEVDGFRKAYDSSGTGIADWAKTRDNTNASGALTRAKELK